MAQTAIKRVFRADPGGGPDVEIARFELLGDTVSATYHDADFGDEMEGVGIPALKAGRAVGLTPADGRSFFDRLDIALAGSGLLRVDLEPEQRADTDDVAGLPADLQGTGEEYNPDDIGSVIDFIGRKHRAGEWSGELAQEVLAATSHNPDVVTVLAGLTTRRLSG